MFEVMFDYYVKLPKCNCYVHAKNQKEIGAILRNLATLGATHCRLMDEIPIDGIRLSQTLTILNHY